MGQYPAVSAYAPVAGLVKNDPPNVISEKATPSCWNVRFRAGTVAKRPGMAELGGNLPVNGIPMLHTEYEWFDGTIFTLLFTTTDAYKYNTTAKTWDFITKQYTTGTVAVTNGSNAVVGTTTLWLTNAVVGDKFRVGTGTWYTIATRADDTHLTLTANYAGTTAPTASYTIRNIFTGSQDNAFDTAFMNDTLIITNGKDAVMKYTGSGNLLVLGGATDYKTEALHYAKAVCEFKDRLFLLNTTEDATPYVQRSRYSELGKVDEWNITQGGGFNELVGGAGNIVRAVRLGRDAMAVYKENSIELGEYVGEYIYFIYRVIVEDVGLMASRTIANIGAGHLYLGPDDVYLFNGSAEPSSAGEVVRDEIFSVINRSKIARSFGYVDRRKQEYYLWIPTSADSPDRCYVYDYRHGTWTKDDSAMTAMGVYRPTASATWADLKTAGTLWSGMAGVTWAEMKTAANRETLVCGNSTGYVYEIDESYSNDVSTAVDQQWDSKDFQQTDTNGNRVYGRYGGVVFEASGASVSVYYSTNGGASWTLIGTQTLSGTWTMYTLDFDVTAMQVRLRFRNNSTNSSFSLRSFQLKILPRSEH